VDVPFVARHANPDLSTSDVLGRLGVRVDRPVALVSFGGYGADGPHFDRLDCLEEWTVLTTGEAAGVDGAGVRLVPDEEIYRRGLRYSDLVRASDVVLTKPGYGIISECIANGTAMIYTSRGHFVEYPLLVRAMPRYLRCRFLDNDSLLTGRWLGALKDVSGAPPPLERPATNGAEVVAAMLDRKLQTANC
jgi:L-arabinokinase